MVVTIVLNIGQVVFAYTSMQKLSDMGTWEDALLINWFHLIKVFMDIYMIQTFIKRIKAKQPSTPLGYLSSYITLSFYFVFLFVHANYLPPNIDLDQITLLSVYVVSDWCLLLFSWLIQSNVVARRNELFAFQAGGITQDKKDDDLFDVRYLPEEYMSDIQEESDEDDDIGGDGGEPLQTAPAETAPQQADKKETAPVEATKREP